MPTAWWPIDRKEHRGDSCHVCGRTEGLSRDEHGRVYCPAHRDRH